MLEGKLNLKKEIIIRYMIDEDNRVVNSIIYKKGFTNEITSQYAITGILHKILRDEEDRLNKLTKVQTDCDIQQPLKNDGRE